MPKLEYKLLFAIIVAGKSAKFAEAVMERLFPITGDWTTYFQQLRDWVNAGVLREKIKEARTGNYGKIEKGFTYIAERAWNLETVTIAQLEAIPGVGPKTARFFLLWTDRKERVAALDVHVLRWMATKGYKVPRSTPSGKKYAEIEKQFIAEADKRGVTPRELDFAIWAVGANHWEKTPAMEELIK